MTSHFGFDLHLNKAENFVLLNSISKCEAVSTEQVDRKKSKMSNASIPLFINLEKDIM